MNGALTKIKQNLHEKEVSFMFEYLKQEANIAYTENGAEVVEDVKGYTAGQAYAVFKIKKKLMLYVHGIRIREI